MVTVSKNPLRIRYAEICREVYPPLCYPEDKHKGDPRHVLLITLNSIQSLDCLLYTLYNSFRIPNPKNLTAEVFQILLEGILHPDVQVQQPALISGTGRHQRTT